MSTERLSCLDRPHARKALPHSLLLPPWVALLVLGEIIVESTSADRRAPRLLTQRRAGGTAVWKVPE